jgi:hypothetical protein
MTSVVRNRVLGIGFAGALTLALAFATAASSAGPMPTNTTLLKQGAAAQFMTVRWHRSWRHSGSRASRSTCTLAGGYHRERTC